MRVLILFFCLLLSWPINLLAQYTGYDFKHLSMREGLSQSTVFSILQDRSGFIWVGTRTGGLNKYDGYSFTQYTKDPNDPNSISGNEIISLFEDSKGFIWIGTRKGGLNKYDPETASFERFYFSEDDVTTILDNTISDIYEDGNGVIWLATNKGVCLYNETQNNFTRVLDGEGGPFGYISRIVELEGKLYFGTKRGIILYDHLSKRVIKKFENEKGNDFSIGKGTVDNLFKDKEGRLWASNRVSGLSRLDDAESGRFTRFTQDNDGFGKEVNYIRTIDQDRNGNLWLGTKGGLAKLSSDQLDQDEIDFEFIRTDENDDRSLSQNSIYSFFEDNNGNFWIGTWSGGLNYLYNGTTKFKHYKHLVNNESTISNNFVSSFAENSKGFWIGTEGGGLNLYNEETNSFIAIRNDKNNPEGISSDHIKAMLVDHDGDFWIGTYDGLNLYNAKYKSFEKYFDGESVYSITEGEPGELWIGCAKKLIKFQKSDKSSVTYTYSSKESTSISDKAINTVFKDVEGQIWIGTKFGLNRYNRETDNFERYFHSNEDRSTISHDFITTIREDSDKSLWIGTFDGLNKYNRQENTFTNYGQQEGLPDNVISNMIFDEAGDLWLTTNKGLCVVTFDKTGESHKVKTRNYDLRDGLQDYEFIMNASYKRNDGRLYFGGVNGFNVFNLNTMVDNTEVPEIALTSFKLNNEEVEIGAENSLLSKHISSTEKITLKHNQSIITFGFVALNYTSTEKNEYAYKMEGFDEDWINIGNRREAYYTNLPAGIYTFRVIGSNNDDVWNQDGTSVIIEVLPAWWNTWWFRLCMGLLVIVLGRWIYIYKSRQIEVNKLSLESKVSEATEEVENQNAILAKEHQQLELAVKETNTVIDQAIESGDFNARVETSNKQGEWKVLSESINLMFDSVLNPFNQLNNVIDRLAQGDMTVRYTDLSKGEIKRLTDNLNEAIENLSKLLVDIAAQSKVIAQASYEVRENGNEMNSSTMEISSAISEMSRGAMDQQAQIDQSSSLLEGILSAANEMIKDAESINHTASSGAEISQTGKELIESLDGSMQQILSFSSQTSVSINDLMEGSKKINSVIRIIKDIASQTNLLALNAAIEAAQAGDAGRGFAVVADEIRKLAEDSKASVGEIEELINAVQQHTNETASLIKGMDTQIKAGDDASKKSLVAFQEISKHYQETNTKSEQIVDKVKKQTDSVEDVVNLSRDIVVISEQTAAGTEEIASSATQLAEGMTNYTDKMLEISKVADELIKKIENFKL